MENQKSSNDTTKLPQNILVDTKPNTVPVIPEDWKVLGVKFGYFPRLAEDLRLWVVGPSGEGKTTFVASIPDNLILDFDSGANGIPMSRAVPIVIRDYDHYNIVIDKLIEDAKQGRRIAKRVTFDTVDEWIGMISNQLQKEKGIEDITEYGREGHGWALIRDRCWSRLRDLEESGYIWTCVGHLTSKTEINPLDKKERTVLREAVFPSFAKKITTKCDFKLTIYCLPELVKLTQSKPLTDGRIIKVPAGTETVYKYYVDSRTTALKEGKSRAVPSMERKFEIPLINGWDEFARRYNEAVAETKQKFNL